MACVIHSHARTGGLALPLDRESTHTLGPEGCALPLDRESTHTLGPEGLPFRLTVNRRTRLETAILRIVGLTPTGRATVVALHLSDEPDALQGRSYWVLAGWHPPDD